MVITRDGMFSQETRNPLIQPQAAPVKRPSTKASGQAIPAVTARQKIAVPSAMIEGKDRSISPVITTKVSAKAMMPNCGVLWAKAT